MKNFANMIATHTKGMEKSLLYWIYTAQSQMLYNPLLDQGFRWSTKKLGDGKGRIAFVSHDEFWHVQLKRKPNLLPWLALIFHQVGGKNLLRLNGKVQNSSFLLSPLNVLNLTHHGIPRSFFDLSTSRVLSSNTATIKPTVAGDENIVFKKALNCNYQKVESTAFRLNY